MPQEITVRYAYQQEKKLYPNISSPNRFFLALTGSQVYDFLMWLLHQRIPDSTSHCYMVYHLRDERYFSLRSRRTALIIPSDGYSLKVTKEGYARSEQHGNSEDCLKNATYGEIKPYDPELLLHMVCYVCQFSQYLRGYLHLGSQRELPDDLTKALYQKWQANENLKYTEVTETFKFYELLV